MAKPTSMLLLVGSLILLLAGCSKPPAPGGALHEAAAIRPLACIAVLPATTSVDQDETVDYGEAQALQKGADYATEVVRRQLAGNPRIRFLTDSQVATLTPELSGQPQQLLVAIAKDLNCDGALFTTVRRFKQREGSEYAVDSPASVDLILELRDTGTGRTLWNGEFEEEQQSFLENILTFASMRKRGFKWVTAEQLVEQGIAERLNECPYLK